MSFKRFIILTIIFILSLVFVCCLVTGFYLLGSQFEASGNSRPSSLLAVSANSMQASNTSVKIPKPNGKFKIYIPQIKLNEDVVKDVDPGNKDVYLPVISENVAHGKWTYTPEETFKQAAGITYLFAHRDGPEGIFKNLDELEIGDSILLMYEDNYYYYTVRNKFIVEPTEIEWYTNESSIPMLRIQTCEDGISKRLIVDAELTQVKPL